MKIEIEVIENWIKRFLDMPSKYSEAWDDGYEVALEDLQAKIDEWKAEQKEVEKWLR